MMRVFLDANVLFAAAISPKGRSAALFLLAESRVCTLLASAYAVTEARRNVDAGYPDAMERFEHLVEHVAIVPEATSPRVAWARQQGVPAEDAPILAAAIDAGVDVLVTGDRRHFGHLFERTLEGVRVLSLAQALILVLERKGR
jgi:predicted nucleic acid-binding protein